MMGQIFYRVAIIVIFFCNLSVAAGNFVSEDIKIYNAVDGITLGATLTKPVGMEPKAALVLATGSGSQNRDEEVFGHRPFKVIAETLSRNGYAVLRFDDRGVGESGGDPLEATVEDYVSDIICAMEMLDSCFSGKLAKGVLGHSEGGTAAIKVANRTPECKFIITLAAPAWQGDSIIMSQARAIATAVNGHWEGEKEQRRYLDLVKSEIPSIYLQTVLYMEVAGKLGDAANLPDVQSQIQMQTSVMCTPGYRAMVRYDPENDIRKVSVPWLALNGDRDMQVLPGDLNTISEFNPTAKTMLMKGHNHLFQKCGTGMVQEYAAIPEDISDEVLSVVIEFLEGLF